MGFAKCSEKPRLKGALTVRLQHVPRYGHDGDRFAATDLAQAAGDLKSVEAREPDVEADDVGLKLMCDFERMQPVARHWRLVAGSLEQPTHHRARVLVVVDDDHAFGVDAARRRRWWLERGDCGFGSRKAHPKSRPLAQPPPLSAVISPRAR
jgi:hypothetical protein